MVEIRFIAPVMLLVAAISLSVFNRLETVAPDASESKAGSIPDEEVIDPKSYMGLEYRAGTEFWDRLWDLPYRVHSVHFPDGGWKNLWDRLTSETEPQFSERFGLWLVPWAGGYVFASPEGSTPEITGGCGGNPSTLFVRGPFPKPPVVFSANTYALCSLDVRLPKDRFVRMYARNVNLGDLYTIAEAVLAIIDELASETPDDKVSDPYAYMGVEYRLGTDLWTRTWNLPYRIRPLRFPDRGWKLEWERETREREPHFSERFGLWLVPTVAGYVFASPDGRSPEITGSCKGEPSTLYVGEPVDDSTDVVAPEDTYGVCKIDIRLPHDRFVTMYTLYTNLGDVYTIAEAVLAIIEELSAE